MRTNQANTIAGHLTAANLFGYQPEKQLPIPVNTTLQPSVELLAIYPAIVGEAYARTMDNYRVYVSQYNFRTTAENEVIDKHNAAVQIYKKNNQLAEYEKQILRNFPKRFSHLPNRMYNQEVDNSGELFSRFLEKRPIQTIKYATEQLFANMLHLYNSQLQKRNDEYRKLKVRTMRPLQELDTNSFHITKLQRCGVASIDVCSKTVRNHRLRLQEAGIFGDSTFQGHKKGVTVRINQAILVILDLATNKIAIPENQSLSPEKQKMLPNNNEPTRANTDEYKKREAAGRSSCDKESAKPTGSFHYKSIFYKNTLCKQENSLVAVAPENVKVEQILSDKLRALIIHPQQLALELAAGHYDNYIPIDVRLLYKEAMGGFLTRVEFRELVIQDFFKSTAKLYRGATPYAGSWKRAINYWMQNKFMTFNNIEFNKANIIDDVTQLRWRLDHARKWFKRTGIPTLYPSSYFDLTRKTAKEIGFEYTMKAWQRHEKYIATEPDRQRRLEKNAKLRETRINLSKKFEIEIRRFLKNRITWPQLADYVERNLPPEFAEQLPATLDRMMSNLKL